MYSTWTSPARKRGTVLFALFAQGSDIFKGTCQSTTHKEFDLTLEGNS